MPAAGNLAVQRVDPWDSRPAHSLVRPVAKLTVPVGVAPADRTVAASVTLVPATAVPGLADTLTVDGCLTPAAPGWAADALAGAAVTVAASAVITGIATSAAIPVAAFLAAPDRISLMLNASP